MISIGLIGCGKQAEKHIQGYKNLGISGENIYIADLDPDQAIKLSAQYGVIALKEVKHIYENASITCVDICTPTPSHLGLIERSLNSGKHYFCEKPLAETTQDAELIADLTQKSKLIGVVGYIYKYAPAFEAAKSIIDNNTLGVIHLAHFRIGGRGSHQAWKHNISTGGGAINEMLVHMLDLVLWYFGRVVDLKVVTCDQLLPERKINDEVVPVDAEDYIMLELKMESGTRVFCQADMITPAFTQFAEIQGENGSYFGSIQPSLPSFVHMLSATDGFELGRNEINTGGSDLYVKQLGYFIDCVNKNQLPDRSTAKQSAQLINVIERIRTNLEDMR